jgi:hypothetical protein
MVREPVEKCDWFVFATWNGTTPTVSVDGYVSRAILLRADVKPSPVGEWMNREIETSKLLPIRQLLQIRPIREVL